MGFALKIAGKGSTGSGSGTAPTGSAPDVLGFQAGTLNTTTGAYSAVMHWDPLGSKMMFDFGCILPAQAWDGTNLLPASVSNWSFFEIVLKAPNSAGGYDYVVATEPIAATAFVSSGGLKIYQYQIGIDAADVPATSVTWEVIACSANYAGNLNTDSSGNPIGPFVNLPTLTPTEAITFTPPPQPATGDWTFTVAGYGTSADAAQRPEAHLQIVCSLNDSRIRYFQAWVKGPLDSKYIDNGPVQAEESTGPTTLDWWVPQPPFGGGSVTYSAILTASAVTYTMTATDTAAGAPKSVTVLPVGYAAQVTGLSVLPVDSAHGTRQTRGGVDCGSLVISWTPPADLEWLGVHCYKIDCDDPATHGGSYVPSSGAAWGLIGWSETSVLDQRAQNLWWPIEPADGWFTIKAQSQSNAIDPSTGQFLENTTSPPTCTLHVTGSTGLNLTQVNPASYTNAEFHIDPSTGKWAMNGVDFTKGFNFDSSAFYVASGSIQVATKVAAGTGYAPNDTLSVNQSGGSGGVVTVLTITGGGGTGPIGTYTISNRGTGYSAASGLATTHITGTGAGATFTITIVNGYTLNADPSNFDFSTGILRLVNLPAPPGSLTFSGDFTVSGGNVSIAHVDFSKAANFDTNVFKISGGEYTLNVDPANFDSSSGSLKLINIPSAPSFSSDFTVVGGAVSIHGVDFSKAYNFSNQMTIVGGATLTLTTLSATIVNAGILSVGHAVGGSNMPSMIEVWDHSGTLCGWVGDDFGGSGYYGAWFKRILCGGASPVAAQMYCDASGNAYFGGTLLAGCVYTGYLSAAQINTGTFSVGYNVNGSNIPGKIAVYNHSGLAVGWIGDDYSGSGYDGAWFKRILCGGTSPGTAQIYCDSSGNAYFGGTLLSGAEYTGALSAVQITSGTLSVGYNVNGSNIPGKIAVYNHSGLAVGWIGDDVAVSGYDGAWFKRVMMGGTSPANAQIWCDAYGNAYFAGQLNSGVSIASPVINGGSISAATLTLSLNSVTTAINNAYNGIAGNYAGLSCTNGSQTALIGPGLFYAFDGSYSIQAYVNGYQSTFSVMNGYSSGVFLYSNGNINVGPSGSLLVINGSTGQFVGAGGVSTIGNISCGAVTASIYDIAGGYYGQTTSFTVTIGGVAHTAYFKGGILFSVV